MSMNARIKNNLTIDDLEEILRITGASLKVNDKPAYQKIVISSFAQKYEVAMLIDLYENLGYEVINHDKYIEVINQEGDTKEVVVTLKNNPSIRCKSIQEALVKLLKIYNEVEDTSVKYNIVIDKEGNIKNV